VRSGQNLLLFSIIAELSPLPLLKVAILLSLISELMVTCLDDRMVNTRNERARAKDIQGNGNPPPPLTLAQTIALILVSRHEQTELLWHIVANSARGGHGARNAPAPAPTTYSDFSATHPPLFTEAGEPLEADHWLRVIESMFGLLRCTEVGLSPCLGSCASPCSSCVVMAVHGGPTTPLLTPRTTK
jgi:hypothetical protein